MMNKLLTNYIFIFQKHKSSIIILILLLGIGLRLFHYIYNRSLWMDEVYLCSSFIHMGYQDLATTTLDYGQKAPIGFLWLVKLTVNSIGYHEIALRLIPLIAGIASLLIFVQVCKYFLNWQGQIIALSVFAFAPALIYHSVEIKQYSTECLATVMALYLFTLYEHNSKWKTNILWGILGGILIWFSFSVIFVLLGIAGGISLSHLLKKKWRPFIFNAAPFLIWIMSFATNYLFFIHKQESDWVVYFFKIYDNFMPMPPLSIQELKWFPRNFLGIMDYPLGLNWNFNNSSISGNALLLTIIPAILLFKGILSIYKSRKQHFYVLIFPLLLTLLASGLSLYPLLERFWLFLAPIFMLLVAIGVTHWQPKIKRYQYIIILLIVASPFCQALYFVLRPELFYKHKKSFEKEALNYVNNHFKTGDAVYNYWNNAPGYNVYRNIYRFRYNAIVGHDFRKSSRNINNYNENLKLDFKLFSGKKRVWLIFNKQFLTDIGDKIDDPKWYYKSQISPSKNIYMQFSKLGVPIKRIKYGDIIIFLFDL